MNVVEKCNGKRILIWGYGREGKSTEQFLKRCCRPASVAIHEGSRSEIRETDYDLIIKSPGIIMEEDSPKYTSQTELFLEQYRDQVIGITGTKGKSTTSTMLYTVLSRCSGREVLLLGNIGQPCLDYFDSITLDTLVVYEMSCHQLAHTKVSPHIAMFLNLFEEHLDYYGTIEKYFLAKSHITQYQQEGDYLLVGSNVPHLTTKAQVLPMPAHAARHFDLKVAGEHNQVNALFVYTAAAELLHCPEQEVLAAMAQFGGLPHRLQHFATIGGVGYYDDSISTIPEATIAAVESIPDVQTVLVGGMDRMIHYDSLIAFMKQHTELQFICMYASGKRIFAAVRDCANCQYRDDLAQAAALAREITQPGKNCVLSPAAASYGYFKNFEERGDAFQQEIQKKSVSFT